MKGLTTVLMMVVMLATVAFTGQACGGRDVPPEIAEQKREAEREAHAQFAEASATAESEYVESIESIEEKFEEAAAAAARAFTSDAKRLRMRQAEEARDSAIERAKRDKIEQLEKAEQMRVQAIRDASFEAELSKRLAERERQRPAEFEVFTAWEEANLDKSFTDFHEEYCDARAQAYDARKLSTLYETRSNIEFHAAHADIDNLHSNPETRSAFRAGMEQLLRNHAEWEESYFGPLEAAVQEAGDAFRRVRSLAIDSGVLPDELRSMGCPPLDRLPLDNSQPVDLPYEVPSPAPTATPTR